MKKTMTKMYAAILGAVLSVTAQASVQTITFAQFSGADFVFANEGDYANLNVAGGDLGDKVSFSFDPLVYALLASPTLEGPLKAHFTINGGVGAYTSSPAYTLGSGARTTYYQPFNEAMVLSFTLDDAFTPTSGSRAGSTLTNLLTVTLSPGDAEFEISGSTRAATGVFDGVYYTLDYTSDFLDFSNQVAADGGFSLSGMSSKFGILNDFLVSFTAQGTGTFAGAPQAVSEAPPMEPPVFSDPVGMPIPVAEPSSLALVGLSLMALALRQRWRKI